MSYNRKVHFSRTLDILSGSAIAGATTKIQKSALYRDFDVAKLEGNKLRDLIDSNFPTFYIVDCKLIARTTIQALINDSDKYLVENEDYVSTIKPKIMASEKELLAGLLEAIGNSNISSKPFLPVFNKLNTSYEAMLDRMSSKTSYIGYRNAAAKFGNDIRTILKVNSVFVASDGPAIVSGLPSTSRVVIGPTFESTKRKVNEELNTVISDFVKGLGLSLVKYNKGDGFTIGNLINAGHTSAVQETGKLIGINMPMAQEKQFLLAGTGKEAGLEEAIADLYLDADYAVVFKQNFTKTAQTLLDMQFSFVVSMPREFNTNELRIGEVSRIKKYIGDTILPSIKEQVQKKFYKGIVQEALNLSASPTILDFIKDSIVSAILGKENKSEAIKTNTAKASTKIKTPALKKSSSKITPRTSSSSADIKLPTLSSSSTNLPSLLTSINKHLQDVIAANMGDGSRQDILNYRTGRFASTVKVERLSLSREGMITAFYSFMKNPYATFSQGGRQSIPTSHDPKLLIAKSIREIAAERVGNRMRSVAV